MGYEFYLDKLLLPITPSKLTLKIKNQNKTYNLINGSEINVLKSAGLTEINFDATFPNVNYPFANHKNGFMTADKYLNQLETLKVNKKPFQFIVVRQFPDKRTLYSTNIKVSLEDYTINEDVKEGFDTVVNIKLKQYIDYGTKSCNITIKQSRPVANVGNNRDASNSPSPKNQNKTYVVKKGDCLWNIAKMFYGDGSKYTIIYNANKDKIKNPNLIYPGQILVIPALDSVSATVKSYSKKKTTSKTKKNTTSSSGNFSSGSGFGGGNGGGHGF